jgi:hypothetical protein
VCRLVCHLRPKDQHFGGRFTTIDQTRRAVDRVPDRLQPRLDATFFSRSTLRQVSVVISRSRIPA